MFIPHTCNILACQQLDRLKSPHCMPLNKEYLLRVFEIQAQTLVKSDKGILQKHDGNRLRLVIHELNKKHITYSDDPLIAYSSFSLTATATEEWRRQKDRSRMISLSFLASNHKM